MKLNLLLHDNRPKIMKKAFYGSSLLICAHVLCNLKRFSYGMVTMSTNKSKM